MSKIRFPSRKQKKKGKLDTSAKTAAWRKPLTARRKPPNSAETLRVPPGGLKMLPGGELLERSFSPGGVFVAPGDYCFFHI